MLEETFILTDARYRYRTKHHLTSSYIQQFEIIFQVVSV